MPQPVETFVVYEPVFACDGGGGALGHPRVFLTIRHGDHIDCPYCGRRYVLDSETRAAAGH